MKVHRPPGESPRHQRRWIEAHRLSAPRRLAKRKALKYGGNRHAARLLIEAKAELNRRSAACKDSAVWTTCWRNKPGCLELLMAASADATLDPTV